MTIRQRGGKWQVDVYHKGKRPRFTFDTREEAEAKEAELVYLLKTGKEITLEAGNKGPGANEHSCSMKALYNLTVTLRWTNTKAQKKAEANLWECVVLLGEDKDVSQITTRDVDNLILAWEKKGNSGGTINRKLAALSVALKVALERDMIAKMPKLAKRPEGEHRIRWLTGKEESAVIGHLRNMEKHDEADFVEILIDTGFRLSELLGFKAEDYSNGLLHLHAGSTKNDQARAVPATKRVDAIIRKRAIRNSGLLFPGLTTASIERTWQRIRTLLKLDHDQQFVLHALRHTCASRLVQRGVPLAVVQKWMGHKAIQTTLRYAHLAPDNFIEAVKVLEQDRRADLKVVNDGDF